MNDANTLRNSRQLARAEVVVDLAVLYAPAPHLDLRARRVRANRQRVARCLTRALVADPRAFLIGSGARRAGRRDFSLQWMVVQN